MMRKIGRRNSSGQRHPQRRWPWTVAAVAIASAIAAARRRRTHRAALSAEDTRSSDAVGGADATASPSSSMPGTANRRIG